RNDSGDRDDAAAETPGDRNLGVSPTCDSPGRGDRAQEVRGRLELHSCGRAGTRTGIDGYRNAVVVEREGGDRGLVPAGLLAGRPAGIPVDGVEEGGVQQDGARNAGNPRHLYSIAPTIEDRMDVVPVEPTRQVRITASDHEKRPVEDAIGDLPCS